MFYILEVEDGDIYMMMLDVVDIVYIDDVNVVVLYCLIAILNTNLLIEPAKVVKYYCH